MVKTIVGYDRFRTPIVRDLPERPSPNRFTIEVGKRYMLRNGSVARIISISVGGSHPVAGIINDYDEEGAVSWTLEGWHIGNHTPCEDDILAPLD